MYKNIFYFSYINKIGGIETFFYQLAKKYKAKDITIIYENGDREQIRRLKRYVRVIKYNKEHIQCEKAFFCFNLDIINNVEAKEYIQILHGDYKAMGIKPPTSSKITKYIGVSQTVCDGFKEITGKDAELIYNPLQIDKPKKVLKLISATRLTSEKGKDNIIKLANILDNSGIPYLWLIFTDDINAINNPNIIYMKPRLDITNYISNADYLVQLSKSEGYCYSVIEALSVGTPVIVTDLSVFRELGVNEDNGFILNPDLSNVDVQSIYNKKFNFKYEPKTDIWDEELAKGKSTYILEKYKVKSLVDSMYFIEEDVHANKGDKFIVEDKQRLDYLLSKNAIELVEADNKK